MGIKKLFKTKPDPEATPEQNREELMSQGITVKSERQRTDRFAAFKDYARNKNENRPEFKPRKIEPDTLEVNPYSGLNPNGAHSYDDVSSRDRPVSNPYSNNNHAISDSRVNEDRFQQFNPYQQQQQQQKQQARGQRFDPYALDRAQTNQSSSRTSQSNNRYDQYQSQLLLDNATINTAVTDLNEVPRYTQNQVAINEEEEEDLNAIPQEYYQDETSLTAEDIENLRLEQEEDEAVNQVKQDIRFTKQQSVASTRNTLRMAEELYASGQNTLGMLGSQSERLYGVQRNLALADVQNKMADDKTKEMVKLNRSIFAVHASNPFNSKRRLRMQEEKIKQNRVNEKILQDHQRAQMHSSERRVIGGLKDDRVSSTTGDIYNKYNDQKILDNAKRYQFENDEEDDDMEREIHQNMTMIGNHASNLKKMAMTIGAETESQNGRMKDIEEDADKLDIDVHINNHRLNGIR